ncbi:MAG: folate-binding protein YgfZ [Alphaproteobacteria bacterium]|nr:folate-binding protein YgfZ [Alphaproteobacteria bacterium]
MINKKYILLPTRGILKIEGPDRHRFLQGLITQDVKFLISNHAVYSALLTPQGRYLHDFFMFELNEVIYLDVEANRLDDLLHRFKLYKLRSQISLSDETSSWSIVSLVGNQANKTFEIKEELGQAILYEAGIIYVDPRLTALGLRGILPTNFDLDCLEAKGFKRAEFNDYDCLRLSLGVPDGSRDMKIDKAIPLECNLDELNAIGWEKGCYMGQELTARTKYVGLVRKRLIPVMIEGDQLIEPGEPILFEGKKIGSLSSRCENRGLALLRLENLKMIMSKKEKLQWGRNFLIPYIPDWMETVFEKPFDF